MYTVLCIAVLLAMTSSASVKSNNDELRELIDEVRSYLDGKHDNKVSARTSAYNDPQMFQTAGLAFDPAAGGYWTKWLNVDSINWAFGPGEFEDCSRVKWQQNLDGKCYLGCSQPVASQISVADPNNQASWDDISKCIGGFDGRATGCGYKCLNDDAANYPRPNCDMSRCVEYGMDVNCTRCPNARVRFYCTGTQPDPDKCCPYSTGCSIEGKRDLRTALEAVDDRDARRDIAVDIMMDVRRALTVDSTEKHKEV